MTAYFSYFYSHSSVVLQFKPILADFETPLDYAARDRMLVVFRDQRQLGECTLSALMCDLGIGLLHLRTSWRRLGLDEEVRRIHRLIQL